MLTKLSEYLPVCVCHPFNIDTSRRHAGSYMTPMIPFRSPPTSEDESTSFLNLPLYHHCMYKLICCAPKVLLPSGSFVRALVFLSRLSTAKYRYFSTVPAGFPPLHQRLSSSSRPLAPIPGLPSNTKFNIACTINSIGPSLLLHR